MKLARLCPLALSGCLAFEGLEPHQGGGSEGGAGGSGGGLTATCRSATPACLLDELNAARTCATIAACPALSAGVLAVSGLPLGELDGNGVRLAFNYSACIDWLTDPVEGEVTGFSRREDLASCLAVASSCGAAEACLGFAPLAPDDARCQGMSGARCAFDDLIDCDAGAVFHCRKPPFTKDGTCFEPVPGAPLCRVASCGADGAACDGSIASSCASGWRLDLDCAGLDLACEGGSCVTSVCPTPYVQSCAGDAAVTCAPAPGVGATEVRFDCGAVGRSCELVGDKARCAPAGASCSPYDADVNVCDPDGHTIRLCVQGRPLALDCGTFGYVCDGPSNGTSAHCGEG